MTWEDRIIVDPEVMVGKPVVKGTRLTVEFLLDLFCQGWSEEMILENYPGLEPDDLKACLSYAKASVASQKVFPLGV